VAARLTAFLVSAIVGVTFVAGLIVGAQRDDYSGPVDLIVYNGRVFTGEPGGTLSEALAVRGNRIILVGSNREIKRLRRRQTTVIDAHGGAVLPGFNDAHAHLVGGGLAQQRAPWPDAVTPADVYAAIRAVSDGPMAREWAIGHGWTSASPPPITTEQRRRAIRTAVREANRLGVTSVHDAGTAPEDLALLAEARESGDLTLRVYATLPAGPGLTAADLDALDAARHVYPDDPVLKTGGVKLIASGEETGAGAWLDCALDQDGPAGAPRFTADELARVVGLLDGRGWQVIVHAVGDAAVRMALDAFERAAAENPAPERGRRHRIEHAAAVDPADLARFASLGAMASVQPFHARRESSANEASSEHPERAAEGRAIAGLRKTGARIVFGSDWPNAALDPRRGVHAAVTHASADAAPSADTPPGDWTGLAEALESYTAQGAYASFDELRKGRLAADMLADIVILSADIFSMPPDELLEVVVTTTIFDGRVVYEREAAGTD
jgi:predicted amidohydrolase YtcJ